MLPLGIWVAGYSQSRATNITDKNVNRNVHCIYKNWFFYYYYYLEEHWGMHVLDWPMHLSLILPDCIKVYKFHAVPYYATYYHPILRISSREKNLQELLLIKTRWTWCYSAGILILSCLPEFNVWKTNVPLSMLQPKTLWKSVSNLNYFLVLD